MTLRLYFHPLSSFCQKVLIALYENGTSFDAEIVNLVDRAASAEFFAMWPIGKIPVLRDTGRDRTLPEASIIIEYLDQHYPGTRPLLPADGAEHLEARYWDRVFDLYIEVPMQKIVLDSFRPEGERDPRGVSEARAMLAATAYGVIEKQMARGPWAIGDAFSIADCAAAPALFYAGAVAPFAGTHSNIAAYFDRLAERPSFKRALAEARPFFQYFPFKDGIRARFLSGNPAA